jgi:two-component system cell cycle response regulator
MSERVDSMSPDPGARSGRPRPLSAVVRARRQQADELYRQARAIHQHDYPRLKELAERSLELASQTGDDGEQYREGMAAALSMVAYYSAIAGLTEPALSQASQALALLDSMESSAILGDIYFAMGWARLFQGDFAEAVIVLTEAERIAVEVGDRGAEAYAVDAIANVYAVSGHPEEALEGHRRALTIQQDLGDELSAARVRNNMAYTYMELGQYDAALESAETALKFISENSHENIEMAVLDTLASVHLARGELDAALANAQRGLALARARESHRDETDSLITLGRIVLRQGRYDEALLSIEQALALAELHGRTVEEYRCHELLASIHEKRGDSGAALSEYRRYHDLERACVNRESQTRLANLRADYLLEDARKDAEIHRLRSLALENEVGEHRIAQVRLEAQASLDPLTGLYNRRHLPVLAEELHAAVERRESVCVVLFDIDQFKAVNDTYGHLAGDRVLVSLAQQLRRKSRATDSALRYGGDEFLMLLVGMDDAAGAEAAERLRAAVAQTAIATNDRKINVTISVGVACVPPYGQIKLPALIARADKSLYAAKQTGGNRVVSF